MKKIINFIIIIVSVIILSSCDKPNSNSDDLDKKHDENVMDEYETITLKADCMYDDTGRYNNNDKISFPYFNEYYIHSSSTCDLIPDFIIAGDGLEYTYQRKLVTGEQDSIAIEMGALILTNECNVKYTRAIVKEVDENQIERNEDGSIKSISYYTTFLTTITIDKDYNYMKISDYKGDKIYMSYSTSGYEQGKPCRLYAFNPLES